MYHLQIHLGDDLAGLRIEFVSNHKLFKQSMRIFTRAGALLKRCLPNCSLTFFFKNKYGPTCVSFDHMAITF